MGLRGTQLTALLSIPLSLGEAGFDKHDIFSSLALVEKICSDDILSPIYDNSNDVCDPHPFKIPMKIVECAMNNCYLGDGTIHPGDHLLFIHELCKLFKCAGISTSEVNRRLFSLSLMAELWNGIRC
jgi:hypothetical protein